ncbi:MAG TPA: hypothetical protein PKE55_06560 [Kiritimatiellia bacterium]|nr:hypothetical protein [Kiritimatiellia bacterium]
MVTDSNTQLSPTANESKSASSKWLMVLELEYGLIQGRELLYAAAAEALKERGVTLSPSDFSRTGLRCHPSHIAERLASGLHLKDTDLDALNAAIVEKFHNNLLHGKVQTSSLVASLLEEGKRMNAQVAVISSLPEDVAEALLARIPGGSGPVKLFDSPEADRTFPRVESWMKAARGVNRPPATCFAVASSQEASKSALAAGMKSIAVPDRFTAFQDFSGADLVIDSDEDGSPGERLRDLV